MARRWQQLHYIPNLPGSVIKADRAGRGCLHRLMDLRQKLWCMKSRAIEWARFSAFLLNAFVSRVNRRFFILTLKFCRSA